MSDYSELIQYFVKAKDIAVFMHVNPDGDCISSSLALCIFLKKKGKNVFCVSPNFDKESINEKFRFLPHFDMIGSRDFLDQFDLCAGVDLGDAGRLGDKNVLRVFNRGKNTVVIDHHAEHIDFAKYTVRESDSASTTQILYKILKQYDEKSIDKDVATCLYAGLITDSGCFSYPNASPETLRIGADLIEYGIDAAEIVRRVMKDEPKRVFDLKNKVLSKAKFYQEGIAVITFSREDYDATGCTERDTEGLINNILNVSGVELAISMSEFKGDVYRVSWRSKHNVNAAACAKAFGGGGHFNAAGCRVYGEFDEAYERVLAVAKEMISYV
ncbi:MAG: bifunctional oligoribonuclease/PAP phosphatase NrnA [Clostridia bacterium]|nr:bifunctional oligoribonuclease/PAP phosphatase NrnA [Clostridia bacterium]